MTLLDLDQPRGGEVGRGSRAAVQDRPVVAARLGGGRGPAGPGARLGLAALPFLVKLGDRRKEHPSVRVKRLSEDRGRGAHLDDPASAGRLVSAARPALVVHCAAWTHGTGCTYASALAAGIAKKESIFDAAWQAKIMVTVAIENAFSLGKGYGSVNVFGKNFSINKS